MQLDPIASVDLESPPENQIPREISILHFGRSGTGHSTLGFHFCHPERSRGVNAKRFLRRRVAVQIELRMCERVSQRFATIPRLCSE
jgi:hypothetical protein